MAKKKRKKKNFKRGGNRGEAPYGLGFKFRNGADHVADAELFAAEQGSPEITETRVEGVLPGPWVDAPTATPNPVGQPHDPRRASVGVTYIGQEFIPVPVGPTPHKLTEVKAILDHDPDLPAAPLRLRVTAIDEEGVQVEHTAYF